MKILSPFAPFCFTCRTIARPSAGVLASITAYGTIAGAAILFSAESFECATIVSMPSSEPGSRIVVMPHASSSLYS